MHTQHRHGPLFALILIVAGALLFLANLGVIPLHDIRPYWPLILVAFGLSTMVRRRDAHGLIWAITLIVFGGVLVLGNLHIIHATASVIWPLLLIAFGAMMLVRRSCPPQRPDWRRRPFTAASGTRESAFFGNTILESAVFSGTQRRVESQNFEGGKVESVFGGLELDLSRATIGTPDRRAVLEVDAVFGGIELRVPDTWKVERECSAIFGGFDDKTVPPRPEPGVQTPTLIIRGNAVFGGIEVKN